MGFLIFLWNCFAKMVRFAGFLFFEIAIFSIIYQALLPDNKFLAVILGLVFTAWIIAEIVLRIVVGGSISVIKYLFGRFI